jgi:hypothetical protein
MRICGLALPIDQPLKALNAGNGRTFSNTMRLLAALVRRASGPDSAERKAPLPVLLVLEGRLY